MKNLILSIMAFLLACCLCFLLFIATNQQALAKVHETISSCSDNDKRTETKGDANHKSDNTISAAVKNVEQEEPYNAEAYVPIAKKTTHNLKNNEIGNSNLPKFSEAQKKHKHL
ncbi:hypothetical protein [Staphylococcus equorum]|uniref:hypothetical protein n=1 Tax=Staphylococcus equorum TaxID=246432 RepID=UPI002981D47A|nr:hypothetical protein [Staphylococcus equorum]MDW5472391.1 hypothetical protein [Staphylococcus equorum]